MVLPEITIDQGKLRGTVATDYDGKEYFRFQGIPYAKPPIGELRFKGPLPPEKWTGTFNATKDGSPSFSRHPFKKNLVIGNESCLFLNIFTRNLREDSENLQPVLFWIHGGQFKFGFGGSEMYSGDFLVTEDVVVVTINYRLGLLGFLSLEDRSLGVPGNAGFKDVVMALKWVNKNIRKFGGDPDNITLVGHSAGAAIVHLLTMSSMSRGLFQKGILQSGCALNSWVKGKRGVAHIAHWLGLEGSSEEVVYKRLMQLSGEEVFALQDKIPDDYVTCDQIIYGLVLENPSREEPFLVQDPLDIIHSGNFEYVPFMIGCTTGETVPFITYRDDETEHNYEKIISWNFGYPRGSEENKSAVKAIKKFYFGHEEPSEIDFGRKCQLYADTTFIYGIYLTVMKQFRVSDAHMYLYRASIQTKLNLVKELLRIDEPVCCHFDEIGYLFKNFGTPKIEPGSIEDLSLRRVVRLWTNFAKFGNPTPFKYDKLLNVTWRPVMDEELEFLDIGTKLTLLKNFEADRMKFWDKLYQDGAAGRE